MLQSLPCNKLLKTHLITSHTIRKKNLCDTSKVWPLSGTSEYYSLSAVSKDSTCNAGAAGDAGSIPGSGREGNGNSLQYCCLGKDRGVWWAVVHGITKNQTRLKCLSMHCLDAAKVSPLGWMNPLPDGAEAFWFMSLDWQQWVTNNRTDVWNQKDIRGSVLDCSSYFPQAK